MKKKQYDETKLIGGMARALGPEVAQELLEITEKLFISKGLAKDLEFECPHCKKKIVFAVTPPKAKLTFTLEK